MISPTDLPISAALRPVLPVGPVGRLSVRCRTISRRGTLALDRLERGALPSHLDRFADGTCGTDGFQAEGRRESDGIEKTRKGG